MNILQLTKEKTQTKENTNKTHISDLIPGFTHISAKRPTAADKNKLTNQIHYALNRTKRKTHNYSLFQ